MKTAEILERAADLIEPEGAWCQEFYALNDRNESIGVLLPAACSWCASGAIMRASDNLTAASRAEALLAARLRVEEIEEWNDAPGRTQSEVVAALRAAAKEAKS